MDIAQVLQQYGPSAVFAIFAWVLLHHVLAQNERLWNNHLSHLMEQQKKVNEVLDRMLTDLREHWSHAEDWHKNQTRTPV